MSKLNLSKSLFLKGMQCHKALWFEKYSPELSTPPDAIRQALFDEGHAIGELALQLYPDGRHIKKEAEGFPHRLKLTKEAIERGEETLYEATFQANQIVIMVDILHCGPKGWEVIEVKSSTNEKPVHLLDLALQAYVLEQCEIPVRQFSILHINSHYERQDKLQPYFLFTKVNLTEKVLITKLDVPEQITQLRTQLKQGIPPAIDIGTQCFVPFECNFMKHCWKDIPEKSVFDINSLHLNQKLSLYRKGIIHMTDVPDTHPLTTRQKQQIAIEKSKKIILNKTGIQNFLNTLHYPFYFLDFEAFQMAIPPYKGCKPYQQIAFQFSLHIQTAPNAPLQHLEFIGDANEDPRLKMAEKLCEWIPQNACILVYNKGFESSVFKQLSELFPHLATHLDHCQEQIIDLMTPFEQHFVYTSEMKGSHSIKVILPALIPELSYDSLEIRDGQSASRAYAIRNASKNKEDQLKLEKNLLEYCKLDTLAMAKLTEKLIELSQTHSNPS